MIFPVDFSLFGFDITAGKYHFVCMVDRWTFFFLA